MDQPKRCEACLDEGTACLTTLNCGQHAYCLDCIRLAVGYAIDDESGYPIHCTGSCDAVSPILLANALSEGTPEDQTLRLQFLAKVEEYSIPASLRVYCASESCCAALGSSQVIDAQVSGDDTRVICPSCDAVTCRACRRLVDFSTEHICEPRGLDTTIAEYVAHLPASESWAYRRCWSCHTWIEKESCCNHMTCRCSAEFCLVCGRKWEAGQMRCPHGCPQSEIPVYDGEGYNQHGFHRDSGLDRDGNAFAGYEDNDDYNDYYEDDEESIYDDTTGLNQRGYDRQGFDADGYKADGFDAAGYDRRGLNRHGVDVGGYNARGYNSQHETYAGILEPGYDIDPAGNPRKLQDEGPSAAVMQCEHQTDFHYGSGTCHVCGWTSDIFYQQCGLCDAVLCRSCDYRSPEVQRSDIRYRCLWPGVDSYGIDAMFARASEEKAFGEVEAAEATDGESKAMY